MLLLRHINVIAENIKVKGDKGMKKLWIILLLLVVVILVCACVGDGTEANTDPNVSDFSQSQNESNHSDNSTPSENDTTSVSSSSSQTISSSESTPSVNQPSTSKPSQNTSSEQVKEDVVYRTPSGKRYHIDPDCGGKNSYSVTISKAKNAGLTPCKKCAS